MPNNHRWFRLRVMLSLSLVYGCANPASNQTVQLPVAKPTASPIPQPEGTGSPVPSAVPNQTSTPKPDVELRVLSTQEIDQLKASGLVDANNRFGWELFSAIYKAEPNANHFISPLSATIALQMAMQGANGTTLSQMKQALALGAVSDQTLLANMPLLISKLRRPAKDITLEIANSLWANQDYVFLPDYLATIRGPYQAQAESLNFKSPETPNQINAWTAKATHDKITNVVGPEINYSSPAAILINAIYFNAKWRYQFDPAETRPRPFYREDGSSKQVKMMRQFSYFPYLSPSESFPHQGVALPYGDEGKLRMYVFLPTADKTLADLQRDLASQDFDALSRRFYGEGGSLELPRFKLDWSRELNPMLKAMGMIDAFLPGKADFSDMVRDLEGIDFFLSTVKQLSYVDVKEEGTEAAAVTVVTVGTQASSQPMRTMSMVVDHPFVFLIRDEETGQILFMGSITDPSS